MRKEKQKSAERKKQKSSNMLARILASRVPKEWAKPPLYRLLTHIEWQQMQADGLFLGTRRERTAGFIHMSPLEEVDATAGRVFTPGSGGLPPFWVLTVNPAVLDPGALLMVTVPSRGRWSFGHLYGPLLVDAVHDAARVRLSVTG